jgi:hypothetical protein
MSYNEKHFCVEEPWVKQMQDFNESFSDYLETYEADKLFNSFFTAVQRAYLAGYKAAGGELPVAQPVFKIVDLCELKEEAESDRKRGG